MSSNCRRHETDWTSAGNEYVFTDKRKTQSRMNRISKWIKDRAKIWINVIGMYPYIGFWNDDELGKCPITVDTNSGSSDAHLSAPCATVATVTADNVSLARYASPNMYVANLRPNLYNFPVKFMPRN